MAITEDGAMPGITSFPRVVRDAVEQFGDLFVCEPERRHFAEYLTGLMIAARKTVRGAAPGIVWPRLSEFDWPWR